MSDYTTIRYEASEGLATLTINRPEDFNGMTNRMLRETYDALSATASDSSIKVLLLTGEGRSFCPGADLNAATSEGNRDVNKAADPVEFRVPALLHELPAVTVAAVNGACAGAGFGWACGCDIRVAARSAMFNTAFLNVAVAGDMGLPWSLPRLVGGAKARELSFFSEKFSADEAYRIGLVARVWDDEVFRTEVDRMVERLLSSSPPAIKGMKAHYVAAEHMSFGDYIDLETEHHRKIVVSEDTREAMRAFLEKRKPKFRGR